MADEQRTKRSAKKPAWMNDEMLIDPAEVEAEVKVPKPHPRRPHIAHDMGQRMVIPEAMMARAYRPTGRMCSNPQCKNPYDSPQWRRGPLGPGTLCNACGTRFARLQAKMNGDKKQGKMRPQERAEWEAFEQQRLHPQVPQQQQQQQTWRMHVQHFVEREQQQQQYYGQDEEYGYADGYEDSDYGYDERSYGSQGAHRSQQHYGADNDMAGPEATEDGQLMCQEGLESPDVGSRADIAAVAAAAAAAAGGPRPSRPVWRGTRQPIPAVDAATDSQEDEAGAYSCQDVHAGPEAAAAAAGGSPAAPSSLLHLLAVGEAMIKTEGVALQERRAAYTEVVGKGLGPEPERLPARGAGGDPAPGVKRSRFALEAEEQQGGRPAASSEPTALQRALERCAAQAGPQRSKPAAGGEHVVAADRFERLLAEAEACVRARSVSPCMLKGVPGPGASPMCNPPAARPLTPLQLGVNAVDAAAGRAGLPRSLMGGELGQLDGHAGIANFMLPAAALPRRPQSAAAVDGYGRGRHASLSQALAAAAAAAAEASAIGEGGEDAGQASPNSQFDATASNAGSIGHPEDGAAGADAPHDADNAAGSSLPEGYAYFPAQGGYDAMPDNMQAQMQALLGQGPMTEPSPVSKMLLADGILSPTTMLMPLNARPRKQARTQGHASAGAGAAGPAAGRRPGNVSNLSRPAAPGDRLVADGTAAMMQAGLMQQAQPMQQAAMAQQGLPQPLLQHMLQQQLLAQQGHQQQHLPGLEASASGAVPSAADLQQAGHRPVVLACQLVLQQQANPLPLRPLFEPPASSAQPTVHSNGQPGLVGSALLAQAGGSGNAQNQLDQLKAVTESAQAAAATASAVAAATALLWQQLQQQEQARERQREEQMRQQQAAAQEAQPNQGPQEVADVGAHPGLNGDGEPAPPGSPAAAAVADPAQAASGSISRSSSSSTSAAGLSTAPSESHGVDKPAAAQAAGPDPPQPQVRQQQGSVRTTPSAEPAVMPGGAGDVAAGSAGAVAGQAPGGSQPDAQ